MLQWTDIIRIEDTVIKQNSSNSKINCKLFDFELLNHQKIIIKSMLLLESACKIKIIKEGQIYTLHINEGYYLDPIHTGRSVSMLSLIKYNKNNLPTVIITNNINKWVSNNSKFSKLNICQITSITRFNKFVKSDINDFDIILIKNSKHKLKYLINIFAQHFVNIRWKRLIIDDFDIIKYPYKYHKINAEFIWYMSYHYITPSKSLTLESLNYINYPLANHYNILKYVENNQFIKYVTIETDSKLLLESMNLFNPVITNYISQSYDINYKEIIKNDLIPTRNMKQFYNDYNLFKFINVLDCKYEVFNNLFNNINILSYYKIKKIITFITTYLNLDIDKYPYDEYYNYTEEDLNTYKTIDKYNSNVQSFLYLMLYKYKFMIYDINNVLLRLHNISSECEICCETFDNNNYAIFKCCKQLSCEICYLNLFKTAKTDEINCPFCRKELNFINSLIIVNKDVKFDQYLYLENIKNIVIKIKSVKTRSIDNIINDILNKSITYEYDIIMSKMDINEINIDQFIDNYDNISIVKINKHNNCQKIIILINDYFKCFNIYENLKHCSILISNFCKFNASEIIFNDVIKCIFIHHTNLFDASNYYLLNYITDIIVISNNEQDVFHNKQFLNLLLLSKLVIKNINIHSIVHSL